MKFSALFAAFLATWAAASPLAEPAANVPKLSALDPDGVHERDAPELSARAPDVVHESFAYQSAKKAHTSLQPGEWYKFYSKAPYTGPGDAETADELQRLQQRLGYNHIAVVVGVVVEDVRKQGRGKKARRVITRDFQSKQLDLIKGEHAKATLRVANFLPGKVYHLDDGAKTTKHRAEKALQKAQAYFEEKGKDQYHVDSNNCDTFARALYPEI